MPIRLTTEMDCVVFAISSCPNKQRLKPPPAAFQEGSFQKTAVISSPSKTLKRKPDDKSAEVQESTPPKVKKNTISWP